MSLPAQPMSALNVMVQAQILDMMQALKDDFNSSIMLITYNLGATWGDVSQMSQR
jgi:oligopeptide transport system ATP-binding protein